MVVPYSLTHATLLASIKRFALACAAGLASLWIVDPVLFHPAMAQDKSVGPSADQLGAHLDPWLAALQLKTEQFSLKALGDVRIDNKPQSVELNLSRHSDEHFELALTHPEYAVTIVRTPELTAVVLPKHRKVKGLSMLRTISTARTCSSERSKGPLK
jgi:hypothetical protein